MQPRQTKHREADRTDQTVRKKDDRDDGTTNCVEEALLIAGVTGSLIGVAARAQSGRNRKVRAAVVFVPAPGHSRTGPDRLHVRLARELARAGIPSLRFDPADGGDTAPAAAHNARHEGDLVAAARQLQALHRDAKLVFVACGPAALPLAAALSAIRFAGLPCRALVFIDPVLDAIDPIAPRSFWQRLTRQPSSTIQALARPNTGASADERHWLTLPTTLQTLAARLHVATSKDPHARALMRNLMAEDRQWQRMLQGSGKRRPALLEFDTEDGTWSDPAHWRRLVDWLARLCRER